MENAGIQPVMPVGNYGDGWGGGGCFMWIIILFWLMSGNNGWNNRGAADAELLVGQQRIQQSIFDSNYAQSNTAAIRDIGNGIASLGYANLQNANGIQRDIMATGNNIAAAVAENRFAAQQCCCETNRNIDSVRYDAAMNTSAINNVATANTQKILDKLCNMEANAKDAEIANLRQALAGSQLAYSQQAQNAQLISALRPFPNPAYIVGSPYAAANTCNCGLGV